MQRQEAEQELSQKLQKVGGDRQALQERVASLQRTLAQVETDQRDVAKTARTLEKDKNALKKTLDKVRMRVLLGAAVAHILRKPYK